METNESDGQSTSDERAYACSRHRNGIWTLWWRHESLRGRLEALDELSAGSHAESHPKRMRETEREFLLAQIRRLRRRMEANGLIFSADRYDSHLTEEALR